MGSRNLICVFSQGEYKIAQYAQWDGYPEFQGVAILKFLKANGAEQLKEKLPLCSFTTHDEYQRMWMDFDIDYDRCTHIPYEKEALFYAQYPQFSRVIGAGILSLVANTSKEIKLWDDREFAFDSLFCEWAYVIDFDKQTFEVYKGWVKKPIKKSERFYTDQPVRQRGNTQYYPVKLLVSFPLLTFPDEKEFIDICNAAAKRS